ncbi:MAG: glycerophosphodiester phosphodiesterase [Treponema sp.]|nr:glycerophosphodiester phosphodiesterase [Treponema sp.]
MNIIAHRGFSGLYPENTMLAFSKAAEAQADEIEMDVQLSRDGKVVIIHDETLERLTGQKGYVKDLDLAELTALNAPAAFGETHGFSPIPSLEEYLKWVKDKPIVTNIELKNSQIYYEELEEKCIELLKKYDLVDRALFSSFNHLSLAKCKRICPDIPCGALVGQNHGLALGAAYYIKSNGLDYFHPQFQLLNDEVVRECKQYEVGINTWTINDMGSLRRAQLWGCRGVISDHPDLARKLLSAHGD